MAVYHEFFALLCNNTTARDPSNFIEVKINSFSIFTANSNYVKFAVHNRQARLYMGSLNRSLEMERLKMRYTLKMCYNILCVFGVYRLIIKKFRRALFLERCGNNMTIVLNNSCEPETLCLFEKSKELAIHKW